MGELTEAKQRWQGELFGHHCYSRLTWIEKDPDSGDMYFKGIGAPGSVTFPICEACYKIIWDWPHFEEAVPEHCVCEECLPTEINPWVDK